MPFERATPWAFEQLSERKALKEHPELQEAYKTMHAAATYFASKTPGKPDAQEVGIQSVMSQVQNRLNAGKTADFQQSRESAALAKEKQPTQPEHTASNHYCHYKKCL